jgi:diaminohydroxyphosphoribosylaminopyrimidine deaminase/5-amino-6-(5-phosphoribosylamino)uracil reductase
MVGALVVRDRQVIGEGLHHAAGGPHAEVEALARAGPAARGATLYVTLEPCNHHGRTPPCVAAILAAGIGRVVAAVADPNPRVQGRGAEALRKAGVEVGVGCLEQAARALNRAFFTAVQRGRPHVVLKAAMSLDGKIAAADGRARWITGPAARERAHRLRSEADAVVVGIGTALADDPALTVRLPEPWPREPFRVVVDSRARLPASAQLIRAGTPGRAIVAVTAAAPADRLAALEARGAAVLRCRVRDDRVDPEDLLRRLFALDVHGVLVEGGGRLAGAFVDAGLADRVALFVAPMVLGGERAPGVVLGAGRALDRALRLGPLEVSRLGPDLLVEADVVDAEGQPSWA